MRLKPSDITPRIAAMMSDADRTWSPQNQYAQAGQPCERDAASDCEPVDLEIPLHRVILKLCEIRDWVALYSNPSKRTGRPRGEPDFVILLPGGKTLLVECKSAKGQLSEDQQTMKDELEALGHTVHIVRSVGDFESICRDYGYLKGGCPT